jgi:hypothetical protein
MQLLARLAGPALLLAAGALRWIDGHDGSLGSEPWWTGAHLVFLAGVAALVTLVADVRRVAQHRAAVTAALVVAVIGAAGIAVVVAGEVSSWSAGALGLPGVNPDVLPTLFAVGVVGALTALAAARQVSWLEPALALLAFTAIAVDLDLLPLAAALLAGALAQAPATRSGQTQPL